MVRQQNKENKHRSQHKVISRKCSCGAITAIVLVVVVTLAP